MEQALQEWHLATFAFCVNRICCQKFCLFYRELDTFKKRSPVYSQTKRFLTWRTNFQANSRNLEHFKRFSSLDHLRAQCNAQRLVSSFFRSGDAATSNNQCSFKFFNTKRYGLSNNGRITKWQQNWIKESSNSCSDLSFSHGERLSPDLS